MIKIIFEKIFKICKICNWYVTNLAQIIGESIWYLLSMKICILHTIGALEELP